MPFMYDPTYILVLPAILLAMYAQMKVSSTFSKFSTVPNRKGVTGANVAMALLNRAGIHDVRVEPVAGNLTDHYDPRAKVLRLSEAVYNKASIAAISVAAHETGHAIQHDQSYAGLAIRNFIFPVVNISSRIAFPLILIGFFLSGGRGALGMLLINIGIILYTCVVAFQIITLPVEFNASSRAIEMLEENNYLTPDEVSPAKKVLNAAALTYVAAAAVAILNLLRFVLLANRRRD